MSVLVGWLDRTHMEINSQLLGVYVFGILSLQSIILLQLQGIEPARRDDAEPLCSILGCVYGYETVALV